MTSTIRMYAFLFSALLISAIAFQNCSDVAFKTIGPSIVGPLGCEPLGFSIDTENKAQLNNDHPFLAVQKGDDALPSDIEWRFPKSPGSSEYTIKSGHEAVNVFTQQGLYKVLAYGRDKSCVGEFLATVNIQADDDNIQPCDQPFIAGPRIGIIGQVRNFDLFLPDCLGSVTSISWNFGDLSGDNPLGATSAEHTYYSEGSFQIIVTLGLEDTQTGEALQPIQIAKDITIVKRFSWEKEVGECTGDCENGGKRLITYKCQDNLTALVDDYEAGSTETCDPNEQPQDHNTYEVCQLEGLNCNQPIDCGWSAYSEWANVGQCDDGKQTQKQSRTPNNPIAQYGGKACEGSPDNYRYQDCGTAYPIDCQVSDWSAWANVGVCVDNLQGQERTRTITLQPANGGMACPALSEAQNVACTQPPTPTPTPTPVDCEWSAWSAYKNVGSCTTSGKKQERTRTHSQEAQNGGSACEGPAKESKFVKCEICTTDVKPNSYLYNYAAKNLNGTNKYYCNVNTPKSSCGGKLYYWERFEKWKQCSCYGPGCSQAVKKWRSCTAHVIERGVHADSYPYQDTHGHSWCDGKKHGSSGCRIYAQSFNGSYNWGNYIDSRGRCK